MQKMPAITHPRIPARLAFALLAPLAALAAYFSFGVTVAQGATGCRGKPAQIVSDASVITGTKAPDVIVAGPGDNTIHGEGGNDLICGGEGNDTIDGERGVDKIYGEGGDDTIEGERGSDTLDGGAGNDKILRGRASHPTQRAG